VWSSVSFNSDRNDAESTARNRRKNFEALLKESTAIVDMFELHVQGRTASDDKKHVAPGVGSWVSAFANFGMAGGLRASSAKLRGEYRSRLCDANLTQSSSVVLIAQGVGATAMLSLASEAVTNGRPCTVLYRGNDRAYAEYLSAAFTAMGILEPPIMPRNPDEAQTKAHEAALEAFALKKGTFNNVRASGPAGRRLFYKEIRDSITNGGLAIEEDHGDRTVGVAFCGGEEALQSIQAIANDVDKEYGFNVEVFGEAFPSHRVAFTRETVREDPTGCEDLQPRPIETDAFAGAGAGVGAAAGPRRRVSTEERRTPVGARRAERGHDDAPLIEPLLGAQF
jgi:hypothetical protein